MTDSIARREPPACPTRALTPVTNVQSKTLNLESPLLVALLRVKPCVDQVRGDSAHDSCVRHRKQP